MKELADTLRGLAAGMRSYVEAKEKGDTLRAEREYRRVSHQLDTMTQFARLGQEKERLGLMRTQQELASKRFPFELAGAEADVEYKKMATEKGRLDIAGQKTAQEERARFSEYFEAETGMPIGDLSLLQGVEKLIQLRIESGRQEELRKVEKEEGLIAEQVRTAKKVTVAAGKEAVAKVEVIDIQKELGTARKSVLSENAKFEAEVEKSGYEVAMAKARKPYADATAEHESALLTEDVNLRVSQIERNAAEARAAGQRAKAAEFEIEAMEEKFKAFGGAGKYYKALFDAEQAKLKADAAPIKLDQALGNIMGGISALQRLAGGGPLDRLTLLFLSTKMPGMPTDMHTAATVDPRSVRIAVEAYIGANMALIEQWYPDADISKLKQQFDMVAGYALTEGGGLREAERVDALGTAAPALEEERESITPTVPLAPPSGTLFDESDYDELDNLLEGME